MLTLDPHSFPMTITSAHASNARLNFNASAFPEIAMMASTPADPITGMLMLRPGIGTVLVSPAVATTL
jgi:hypothetical protein